VNSLYKLFNRWKVWHRVKYESDIARLESKSEESSPPIRVCVCVCVYIYIYIYIYIFICMYMYMYNNYVCRMMMCRGKLASVPGPPPQGEGWRSRCGWSSACCARRSLRHMQNAGGVAPSDLPCYSALKQLSDSKWRQNSPPYLSAALTSRSHPCPNSVVLSPLTVTSSSSTGDSSEMFYMAVRHERDAGGALSAMSRDICACWCTY